MKLSLIATASLAAFVVAKKKEKDSNYPIEVSLEAQEGSVVKVKISNLGPNEVNLFSRASILDPNPVRKLNLTSTNGEAVKFIGAHARVALDKLNKKSFETLKKKGNVEVSIDLAELYDISEGGTFEVMGESKIPWAKKKSTKLEGDSLYTTNKLTITVPKQAPKMKLNTVLMSDCTGQRYADTRKAEAVCAMLAVVTATSALYGDAEQFFRYFRTYDPAIRQTVAKRYYAVSDECSGKTRHSDTFCSDALQLCKSDYISVTYGTKITTCDLYWRFPTLTNKCHDYDQATLTIHETTHVDGLFDPSTDDIAYGWPKITELTADQAIRNGETYAHYANAVYAGC